MNPGPLGAALFMTSMALCFSAHPASAEEKPAPRTVQISAELSAWKADCKELPSVSTSPFRCGIPKSLGTQPATTQLDLPLQVDLPATQADSAVQTWKIGATETDSGLQGKLTLYSVSPGPAADGTSLPPYIQVRIDLFAPVRATCAESIRLRDPVQLPPVICAGYTAAAGVPEFEQRGVTVKFAQTKP